MSYRDFVKDIKTKPAIVAHRGAWHHGPENSLKAIEAAIEAGYEIAEVDIQKSADGTLFLLHDESLKRMTGIDRIAAQLPLCDIQSPPMQERMGGDGAKMTGHHIPILKDALDLARNRIFLDLDVKFFDFLPDVARLVAEMGMQNQVDIKIKVQSEDQGKYLRELEETYGLMVMPMTRFEDHNADELIGLLKSIGANVVETKFDALETIARRAPLFEAADLTIWVNSLDPVACCALKDSAALEDPDAVWGKLLSAGVRIIQTDEPEALMGWR
ncbi:glycerophosphodiester phosphodiesterase family protein [uncultured Cohaesibacter sp.]|uniref:glycerophosphodiester phosphodiesterase family protein n=1 Tax=uncultured Cohaesibacter sp. TaxID=1002546 RepID=UPI0029C6124C|nr:glycerophosphodiester phosphodiesterase family protein [uncultured Cohaesibacter sp.]